MMYFPICLDIQGRCCIVVGGGLVAARKVASLLEHGGLVRVISPELTPELRQRHVAGDLEWRATSYQEGDLDDAFLVIAATDDEEVQARVHAEATARRILLNVADVPKWCNFILPATLRRGDLNIAVSTSGKSPALAKRLRRELEARFGPEYGELTEILGSLRPLVLAMGRPHSENQELFSRLLHDDFPAWVRERNWPRMAAHLRAVLGPVAETVEVERLLGQASWHDRGSGAV
jgi:precorrin-2 dehydrogenase/sirohydrochlorin ferrochelatase